MTRRVLHWTLVIGVALSALALINALNLWYLHKPAGYAALAAVVVRVAWGARARRLRGAMTIARVLCVVGLALTGWLYTTDMFWGSEAVEGAHLALAWAMLALVAWHIAKVIAVRVKLRKRAAP